MNARWLVLVAGLVGCGASEAPPPGARTEPTASRVPTESAAPPLAERVEWAGVPNARRSEARVFAGQPSQAGLEHAAQEGVVAVINLRDDDLSDVGYDEAAACSALGLSYRQIPIDGANFSEDDVRTFVEALDAAEGPVLVHCKSGNRVGALWALYLARTRGVEKVEALEHGHAAGLRKAPTTARTEALLDGAE